MSHLNTVQAAFSAQAKNFSQAGLTVTDPHHLGWMVAHLKLEATFRVLDMAAGTGLLSGAMAAHVKQILALDATPVMIREGVRAMARTGMNNVAFVNGLAEELPVVSNSFDVVICRFAVHHLLNPAQPVSEMVRACREEAPVLEATWREYRDRGVVFVGVDYLDTETEARQYMAEFDLTYPNGPDVGTRIATLYRIKGMPETFFVNAAGKLRGVYVGPITAAELRQRIEALLQE